MYEALESHRLELKGDIGKIADQVDDIERKVDRMLGWAAGAGAAVSDE